MASIRISQKEANELLDMLKHTLVSEIDFPSKGKFTEFSVIQCVVKPLALAMGI